VPPEVVAQPTVSARHAEPADLAAVVNDQNPRAGTRRMKRRSQAGRPGAEHQDIGMCHRGGTGGGMHAGHLRASAEAAPGPEPVATENSWQDVSRSVEGGSHRRRRAGLEYPRDR
jgi:hypothetical protein